jgi:hypothetical protein
VSSYIYEKETKILCPENLKKNSLDAEPMTCQNDDMLLAHKFSKIKMIDSVVASFSSVFDRPSDDAASLMLDTWSSSDEDEFSSKNSTNLSIDLSFLDVSFLDEPVVRRINIFYNAIDRNFAGKPVSNVLRCGRNTPQAVEYIMQFASQTHFKVPTAIIEKFLKPYMANRMLFGRSRMNTIVDHGAYFTCLPSGKLTRVVMVPKVHVQTLQTRNYVFYTKGMVDFVDEVVAGSEFFVENGTPEHEINRRFWVTVFNRRFNCGWWNFFNFIQ